MFRRPGAGVTSLEFAELARRLGSALRSMGLVAPGFRSPPRSPQLTRSLSRHGDGSFTVAVRLRSRSALAVTADMIDGAVAANGLAGAAAARARDRLWGAAEAVLSAPVAPLRSSAFPAQAGRGEVRAAGPSTVSSPLAA